MLADASAEKATQAPDTDLGVETECLLTSLSTQSQLYLPTDMYPKKRDQGHDPARILTATCKLAIDKGVVGEGWDGEKRGRV